MSLLAPGIPARYRSPHASGAVYGAESTDSGDFYGKMAPVFYAASLAGTGLGTYHGYKRDDSIGWAIAWGLLGGIFWPIAIPVMFAQGLGKPAR